MKRIFAVLALVWGTSFPLAHHAHAHGTYVDPDWSLSFAPGMGIIQSHIGLGGHITSAWALDDNMKYWLGFQIGAHPFTNGFDTGTERFPQSTTLPGTLYYEWQYDLPSAGSAISASAAAYCSS